MAKTRVLARVGIKAKDGELVYYKNGVLYAVKAKRGGTKGAKKKKCSASSAKKKVAPKRTAVSLYNYRKGDKVLVKLTKKTDDTTGWAKGIIAAASSGSSQLVEYKLPGGGLQRKYKNRSELKTR